MATFLEIKRKNLLDAIARELYGWPNEVQPDDD